MLTKYLNRRADPNSKKRTLQVVFTTVLVVPFVTQMIVIVGLTGWLSLRTGKQAVNAVAAQLTSEIADRIQDQLQYYLEIPHKLNQLNADAAQLGQIDFNDLKSLELRWWRQVRLYDTISGIGFGSIRGEYTAGDRRDNQVRLGRKDNTFPDGALRMYETDSQGNRLREVYKGNPNYDPRLRPWYKLGQVSPEGHWTEIFTYSSQAVYAISAVRGLYDSTGKFQGTLITDLILSDISHFLQQLEVGRSGETFIMERSGLLVASSSPEKPFTVVNDKAQRLYATASRSPLVSATAAYLRDRFGDLNQIRHPSQLTFELNDQRQFLQILPYKDSYGLDWLIVVVVPESDFVGQIEANTRSTIAIGAFSLVITLLVGLLISRWIVRPIVRLSAAATALANGDWDAAVPIEREDELGVLAAAFNRMAEQLQSSLAALKEREAKLAEAQQVAHLGSWEVDLVKQTVSWSDELFRIYGLEPSLTPLSYPKSLQWVHPDDVEFVQQAIAQSLNRAEPFAIDYRLVLPNGQIKQVHGRGQATFDDSGQAIRLFGTVTDITARKQAERERDELLERERVARAEAEAANRTKDEFLAVLSHELRTPLNPILGWVKLLRSPRQFDPDKTAKALEIVERNALLLTQLIEDLLDVSRILRGKLTLNPHPVDLANIITAAIETVRLSAEAKSIEIHSVLDPHVGKVHGDPNRLQQAIWNLISNAVKFTPDRGQIWIRLYAASHPTELAVVEVRDTGKGIQSDFLPHVFEYFRQADSTTTRTFGGLGLGLAIVRHLVELHGGTVSAWSEGENQGSTFTLKLPVIEEVSAAREPVAVSASLPSLAGARILIVDDEVDTRQLIVFILEQFGATVQTVASAQEALEAIALSLPDVLISDIGMPDMDGYMLIRQIRKLSSESGGSLKAIALTAYASDADSQQALQAGFNLHLTKPVDPEQLVRAIANLTASLA